MEDKKTIFFVISPSLIDKPALKQSWLSSNTPFYSQCSQRRKNRTESKQVWKTCEYCTVQVQGHLY